VPATRQDAAAGRKEPNQSWPLGWTEVRPTDRATDGGRRRSNAECRRGRRTAGRAAQAHWATVSDRAGCGGEGKAGCDVI